MTPTEFNTLLSLTEGMDMPLDDRKAMVKFTWLAMEAIVDKEWNINPVRCKRGELELNHLQNTQMELDSKLPPSTTQILH